MMQSTKEENCAAIKAAIMYAFGAFSSPINLSEEVEEEEEEELEED